MSAELSQWTGLARGWFGQIPPELLARHLLEVTPEADEAVRRAALQALARRYRFAARDELVIVERPLEGLFGSYRTARMRSLGQGKRKASQGPRPYQTELRSLSPLATSCGCADFVRSSLGLCKHGLAVLDAIAGELGRQVREPSPGYEPAARWDFRLALRDHADRLARVQGASAAPPLADPEARLRWIDALEPRDPALRTLLDEERERAQRALVNLTHAARASEALGSLRRQLYPYQRAGVERFFATGRLLLADDIGLGKTTQAVACCHGLFASGRIERGAIIVPLALKAQWRREWEATSHVPITVVEGTPAQRARMYKAKQRGFLLLGYEQLVRDLEWVLAFAPELVVLDEAQRIKNWATKSAEYVKALSPTYRLVLTGTPLENRLDELASIMDFVDDVALEPKWRLSALYGIDEGRGGLRNLDHLRACLAPHMLRRVRREVLDQLPPRVDTPVPVPLTEPQREAHDELRRPIAQLCARAARRPLAPAEFMRLMKLLTAQRMICNGLAQQRFDEHWPRIEHEPPSPALLEGLFAPKLSALRGLLEQIVLVQGRKVLVFSQWRNMLRLAEWALRDVLAEAGKRAVFFTGAESAKERDRAVTALHEDESVAVMLLSDAGGVGLNLQHATTCCINLELPWNPAVLEQRIGRIHRLGQSAPVDVYNLICEDGIEGRIARLLANKGALFEAVFDGDSDQVAFASQGSFLARMNELVEPMPELSVEELDAELEIEDEAEPLAAPTAAEPERQACAQDALIASLAQRGVHVERAPDGALRIHAPAEHANALLASLSELAARLDTQA